MRSSGSHDSEEIETGFVRHRECLADRLERLLDRRFPPVLIPARAPQRGHQRATHFFSRQVTEVQSLVRRDRARRRFAEPKPERDAVREPRVELWHARDLCELRKSALEI